MRFSDLTQRIAGDGAAAWDIHYRALALREQGHDILLLSVGDPDFDTPQPIVQGAIDSLLAGDAITSPNEAQSQRVSLADRMLRIK